MLFAYWVHDLSPFIVRFSDNFGIRYYGVAYLMGFLGGALLLHAYARAGRSRLPSEKIPDLLVALVLGVLLGGRLGYFIFYGSDLVRHDPLVLFRVWEGGMASHGGFIGVALALAWFSRSSKIPFLHLGDLIVSVAPLGLLFGRLANFINGELWGKIADVPWAVIFPASAPEGTPLALIPPRHPSQLYEAALEGVLLLAFMQARFWRTDVIRRQPGRLAGEFLIAYAGARALGELFREPDAGLILGLSRGTFYSIFLVAAGLALIFLTPRAAAKSGSPA
ncbi:MAG: prolipoprotein diacylglyceryl transferase [Verrucomicrobia bacterium]|nr:prolipoprotein diacylglyceryl transferase [Verrucomicrobiota bacterium]